MTGQQAPSLATLAAESGTPVPCAGNLPLDIGDSRFVWFVDQGAVDLFLIEHRDGIEQSAPEHLLRADSGRLLPGVAPQEGPTTLALIAKGFAGHSAAATSGREPRSDGQPGAGGACGRMAQRCLRHARP